MVKIEHIALWVSDLSLIKDFYTKYFNAKSGPLYHNPTKGFQSYFLSFESGARIEIMTTTSELSKVQKNPQIGYVHLAISVGSKNEVVELTDTLRNDGVVVIGEPRLTGDGYFESVIKDPDGNLIEITI